MTVFIMHRVYRNEIRAEAAVIMVVFFFNISFNREIMK